MIRTGLRDGRDHVLEADMDLPLARDVVFAFFGEAGNLERITPPELRFRIVTPQPIAMRPGAEIRYRLSLFGVPFGWTSRITRYEPPHAFTDEQVAGPYARWIHTHDFEDTPGGTRIRDRVRYRLPFVPLGNAALPLVQRQLHRIFTYRQTAVRDALQRPMPTAA